MVTYLCACNLVWMQCAAAHPQVDYVLDANGTFSAAKYNQW